MADKDQLWNYIDNKFKQSLSKVSYDTWISSAKAIEFSSDEIVIEVPSELHKEYWGNNLATQTMEFLFEYIGREIQPRIVTEDERTQYEDQEIKGDSAARREFAGKNQQEKYGSKLSQKYTFDTFVIGKGNQMAHAAALVVAEEPGTIYNPLFFYGGVGLGKTHLMHAIGHQLLEIRPHANVKYVTSENFANDYISSIRNQTMEEFRQAYRNIDLLLVDDIQFFADKEGTQEEFFHTFNELYDKRKQIVLTSDRLPNEIPQLEERLVSRFAWGLSVDITPPDLETRIAILKSKAEAENLEIPGDTLSYIAGQIDSNIRELEGALLRVQAFAAMSGQEITTSLAADALKSMLHDNEDKEIDISTIQKAVGKYYNVSREDLLGKRRTQSIAFPRQVAMYLCREMTSESFPKIGKEFGGKDHTTVMYGHEKIEKQLQEDENLRIAIDEIKQSLS